MNPLCLKFISNYRVLRIIEFSRYVSCWCTCTLVYLPLGAKGCVLWSVSVAFHGHIPSNLVISKYMEVDLKIYKPQK